MEAFCQDNKFIHRSLGSNPLDDKMRRTGCPGCLHFIIQLACPHLYHPEMATISGTWERRFYLPTLLA
jgi:hypothetical protein